MIFKKLRNYYLLPSIHKIFRGYAQKYVVTWFRLKFKQRDPNTGELESLSFDFNLCEAVAAWERVSLLLSVAPF